MTQCIAESHKVPTDDATARTTTNQNGATHACSSEARQDGQHAPAGGHARRGPPRRGMEHGHRRRVRLSRFPDGVGVPYLVRLDEGSTMVFALAEAIRPLPCFFDYLNDDLVRMVVWATTEGGRQTARCAARRGPAAAHDCQRDAHLARRVGGRVDGAEYAAGEA